ncbi:MAG: RnfABCDGE type electron transport complex subunit B [Clostridia bacterium]|nr:RnfABCDGE type electron transport complex subunit B [Clostridia bacterium]MBQ4623526.1 RnfABCDGE type electron transport complex subunit B [Clostridia bacterium]
MTETLFNTLKALAVVGGSSILFGYLLSVAAKFFYVKIDERIEKVQEVLPGANCGGCGYSGCAAYAEACVKGAPCNLCNAGGQAVANKIATITGRESGTVEEKKAFVYCSGGGHDKNRYEFFGMHSCIPASRIDGGPHLCTFACLGFGSCVKVCNFNAISVVNGVAKVDQSKCTGCGACVAECPKGIIGLVPASQNINVPCRSHMKGADTMKACTMGCIGCKKCEKACTHGAITVKDSLASIDPAKCVSCGDCFNTCPRNLIVNIHGSPFFRDYPEDARPAPPVVPAPKAVEHAEPVEDSRVAPVIPPKPKAEPAPAPVEVKPAPKPVEPKPEPAPVPAEPKAEAPAEPAPPADEPAKAPEANPVNLDGPAPKERVDEIFENLSRSFAELAGEAKPEEPKE